jgi:hypothetical protein
MDIIVIPRQVNYYWLGTWPFTEPINTISLPVIIGKEKKNREKGKHKRKKKHSRKMKARIEGGREIRRGTKWIREERASEISKFCLVICFVGYYFINLFTGKYSLLLFLTLVYYMVVSQVTGLMLLF